MNGDSRYRGGNGLFALFPDLHHIEMEEDPVLRNNFLGVLVFWKFVVNLQSTSEARVAEW